MKRRIYLVTPGGARGRGGIGRMVAYLAGAWKEDERAADLVIVDSYGPDRKTLMPIYFLAACLRITASAALGRIDLLHVNMSERASVWRKGLVVWLGTLFNVPVLLHWHGADFIDYYHGLGPVRRRLLRATLHRAERTIVLGAFWRRFAVGELGLPIEKVGILANAVPDPRRAADDPPCPVPAEGGAERPTRIVFLGRLGARKGVPELLEALSGLAGDWTAVLAGDGEVGRFRTELAVLGLDQRVRILEWVDAATARRLLAEGDILVLPSRNEGLPMAVLEAMSHGLAVVATTVGSVPDAVQDGESGLLVPAGDAKALGQALARLVADSLLRRRLGERARRRFEAEFSLPVYVERLARIYAGTGTKLVQPVAAE
ncbi:MAG: glycosyltransferase family 4 protein [Geminicoccaceae bacterium]|nr:glycosyltransferase family 4 protein [Geminicoccaceae bacterium]